MASGFYRRVKYVFP